MAACSGLMPQLGLDVTCMLGSLTGGCAAAGVTRLLIPVQPPQHQLRLASTSSILVCFVPPPLGPMPQYEAQGCPGVAWTK
jgi:hypothetical protein